jgi:hypothetical protein
VKSGRRAGCCAVNIVPPTPVRIRKPNAGGGAVVNPCLNRTEVITPAVPGLTEKLLAVAFTVWTTDAVQPPQITLVGAPLRFEPTISAAPAGVAPVPIAATHALTIPETTARRLTSAFLSHAELSIGSGLVMASTGFARVTIDAETGTVVWPGGADLAPDTLYERVRTGTWPQRDTAI